MTSLLGFLALFLVLGPALICIMLFLNVLKMSEPEGLLETIPNGPEILAENPEFAERHRWAERHGFVPHLMADFRGVGGQRMLIAVWYHAGRGMFLSSYSAAGRICCEFVSYCERDVALTTSNTRDSLLFPTAPDSYIEAFDRLGLDELYQRHDSSLTWLGQNRGVASVRPNLPTEILIVKAVGSQMAHVRTLPLWPLRGPWWYWGRRNLLNNKPIAERYRD